MAPNERSTTPPRARWQLHRGYTALRARDHVNASAPCAVWDHAIGGVLPLLREPVWEPDLGRAWVVVLLVHPEPAGGTQCLSAPSHGQPSHHVEYRYTERTPLYPFRFQDHFDLSGSLVRHVSGARARGTRAT